LLLGEGPALLCVPDPAPAESLRYATAWYWWLLFEMPSYPVLWLSLELAYPAGLPFEAHLPFDVAEPQARRWLTCLQQERSITIHVLAHDRSYCYTRELAFPAEHRSRLSALIERAERSLASVPPDRRGDFRAAVAEVERLLTENPS
jgi:hypothetical protein